MPDVRYYVEYEAAPHWRCGVAIQPGEMKAEYAEEWMVFLRDVAVALEHETSALNEATG